MKKTLIAASVGALMLAAAGTASANSLLFPFFTTAGGATSILSISGNAALAATERLHYVYNYGASCTHYDGSGSITPNDLLQHSVAAPAAGGFGKAVALDKSTPFYFPLNDYGFMVVSNTTSAGLISGDIAIADPATGLIVSYAGVSNQLPTNVAGNEGNFSTAVSTGTDNRFNLSFYPSSLVATSWYGAVTGNMNPAIVGNRNWTGTGRLDNQGNAYDNDENAFSGCKSKDITCAGIVQPADLMNSAQLASVGPNGGLLHVLNTPLVPAAPGVPASVVDTSTGIAMTKLQVLPGKIVLMHREQAPAF